MDLRSVNDVTLQDGLFHMAKSNDYADGNFLYRTYNTFTVNSFKSESIIFLH